MHGLMWDIFIYRNFFSKIKKKFLNKFFATIKIFFRNYKKIFFTTIKKFSHNYNKISSQLYKKNFFPTKKNSMQL